MKHDSCFLGPCLPSWFCERIPIVSTLVDVVTRLASTMRHERHMLMKHKAWHEAWHEATRHEERRMKHEARHEAWNMKHETWCKTHDVDMTHDMKKEARHEARHEAWDETWCMDPKHETWHEARHQACFKTLMTHETRFMFPWSVSAFMFLWTHSNSVIIHVWHHR